LRADEKHIRTQSTILWKTNPQAVFAFINNRVFHADALFIRMENAVGARSAQSLQSTIYGEIEMELKQKWN